MKTKKIISLVLASFVFIMMFATPTMAADVLSFSIDAADLAIKGSTYQVVINSNVTEALGAGGIIITYDKTALDYVSGELSSNTNASFTLTPNEDAGSIAITAFANAAAFNGTFATIVFDVISDTTATSFDITVAQDPDAIFFTGAMAPILSGISFDEKADVPVKAARNAAPTFDVAVDGTAVSGGTVTAAVTNFVDPWGYAVDAPEVTWTYEWTNGKTGASITLDASDYVNAESTIGVSATATISGTETNNTATIAATPVAVTLPATAPTLTVVETREDTVAVGTTMNANATATADALVGGDCTISYTWKVEGVTVGTDAATYEIKVEDYGTGTNTLTCDVVATSRNGASSATKTVTFTKDIVAGNMPPVASDVKVKKGDAEVTTAVVGDVLTGVYTYNDVKDTATTEEITEESTYQWYRDGVAIEGATAITYTVVPADKGTNLTFEVTPISSDDTPNTVLQLEGTAVTTGTPARPMKLVDDKEVENPVLASANPAYAPKVSNVAISGGAIVFDNAFEVTYDFEDKNGYGENLTITFEKEDTTDVTSYVTVADGKYTVAKDNGGIVAGDKIVAVITPAAHADAVTDSVAYDPSAFVAAKSTTAYEVYNKKSGGSSGMTGPVLGGGGSKPSTTPTTSPEPTTTPEPTDAPVVVPAAKDCITLTIGKADVNVFGESKANDVAPVIRNDRTMLPARIVAEALGATVAWDGEARKVTITKGDVTIVITIDADKALVNGEEIALDSAAFIESDRTYLPMRFLGEKLGAEVTWNGATQEVYIVPAK